MIHIIEGPDGVGKTTYAKKLSRAWRMPVIHFSAPTHEHWIDEYVIPVQRELDHSEKGIILDRGFFAEPMWASIFNRPSSIFKSAEELDSCALWYRQQGCMITFIERDTNGIIETSRERGETPEQTARALKSVEPYRVLARSAWTRWGIPTRRADSDTLHRGGI